MAYLEYITRAGKATIILWYVITVLLFIGFKIISKVLRWYIM